MREVTRAADTRAAGAIASAGEESARVAGGGTRDHGNVEIDRNCSSSSKDIVVEEMGAERNGNNLELFFLRMDTTLFIAFTQRVNTSECSVGCAHIYKAYSQ